MILSDAQLKAICDHYRLTPSEQLFAALRFVHNIGKNADVMHTKHKEKEPSHDRHDTK